MGIAAPAWWLVCGGVLCLWFCLYRRGYERLAGVVLLVAAGAVAGGWHHCRWSLFPRDDLGHFARPQAAPACVEAVAVKGTRDVPTPAWDPMQMIPRGRRTRVELAITAIRDGTTWRPASGRTVLTVNGQLLGIRAGDRIRVFGQLARPRRPANPGQYDYAAHLRADRCGCLLRTAYPDCVSLAARASDWNPTYWTARVQAEADTVLWRHLDPRRAGLAAALLLGDREELDPQETAAFRETGTVHLLAISGLHVGILVLAVAALARAAGCSRRQAALAIALVAVFYTLLTDARAPAVRATILVLVACAAVALGRRVRPFNSLAAAALVILAINPADLFRIGPQLSFLAVAALMWYAPTWFGTVHEADPIDRLIEASRPWPSWLAWGALRSARHVTLASATIWLITLPLTMAWFHLAAPVAIVLNTFLWIPIAAALWSGFAVLGLGWLCPPLARPAAWVCDGSLDVVNSVVQWARGLSWGHFWLPGPAGWWLVGCYGALGAWAAFPRVRPPLRWRVALLVGWVGVGLGAAAWPDRDGQSVRCTFLAVGHGCAAVVELPSGQTILYDAGSLASPNEAADAVASYFWWRGRMRIDAVVLSHPDADHYNALPRLLERFAVGTVYVSPFMFERRNASLAALRGSIDAHGVPIAEVRAGDHLESAGNTRVEVLHPPERGALDNDNANSVVLLIEAGRQRLLLTGDLETPGLEDLLAEEPLDCDVLMVPHHGSRRSNPPGLAAWCRPEWAVISGSLTWDPATTEAAYQHEGASVHHTGRVGAVQVQLGAPGVAARGWLSGEGWE